MRVIGKIHDAYKATIHGVECWIAALHDEGGRLLSGSANVQEVASPYDGRKWCEQRAAAIGAELIGIETMPHRSYQCCCCAARFETAKPQDPNRDTGYGTCAKCRIWILVKDPSDYRHDPKTDRFA